LIGKIKGVSTLNNKINKKEAFIEPNDQTEKASLRASYFRNVNQSKTSPLDSL
jgi:hypothetical protein